MISDNGNAGMRLVWLPYVRTPSAPTREEIAAGVDLAGDVSAGRSDAICIDVAPGIESK